jgi:predicted transcriptional regulator
MKRTRARLSHNTGKSAPSGKRRAQGDLLIDLIRADVEGHINLPRNVLIIHSMDTSHCSIFTKKRMELLRTIRKDKGLTVQQLASTLHRKKEAVSRDLKLLEHKDLISIHREGRTAHPAIKTELILFSLAPEKHLARRNHTI